MASAIILPAERDRTLDTLRGFALLGILLINIKGFSMPEMVLFDPHILGQLKPRSQAIEAVVHTLVSWKFIGIFSILFGVGIVMLAERSIARGQSPAGVFYRRMGMLAVLGLLHGFLIWFGDILFHYAIIGMLLYLLRRMRARWLMLIAAAMLAVHLLITLGIGWAMQLPEVRDDMFHPLIVQDEIDAYRGGWLEQMSFRSSSMLGLILLTPFFGLWFTGGMMLLGMTMHRVGVFSGRVASKTIATVGATCFAVGLTLAILHTPAHLRWPDSIVPPSMGMALQAISAPLMSVGYIAGMILLCKTSVASMLYPLTCLGRLSLSGYLLTSVICTLIFYGHGLGLFAKLGMGELMLIVLGVWAVLLVLAPLYLSRFRIGPAEWLVRAAGGGAKSH
jgi:uncharacterized protein